MKFANLRTNHVITPIGYQFDKITFSYVISEAKGKKQSKAQIKVATDEKMTNIVYDSGLKEDINGLGTTVNMELQPYTRYYWTVSAVSDEGDEDTSEVTFFETSKLSDRWTAKWITCDMKVRQPLFFKNFSAKDVTTARLYITGLGLYHATINGQDVTKEKLTPYYTDYNNWVQYQTYDVTDLIKDDNLMEVTLGNGWYGGRFGFSSKEGQKGYYGEGYKMLAELRLVHSDGTVSVIASDDSWNVKGSNYTFSNIYDGEHRDDTLPETEIVKASILGDADMFPVKERLSLPVVIQKELPAIELINTPAGEKVYDIGQNLAGGFRLHLHEKAGTKIHIQVGEVLQKGNFYRDNLRTARAEYYYTSNGEEVDLEPMFTFYGYRYIKVDGATNLKKEDMTGLAYYSDVTPVGRLTCGDDKINKLLSNIAWGQRGNFIDVPTDCPQRDERMGWTADTQVFVPTANYMTDSYAFYRKYLYELRGEQNSEGRVTDVIPSTGVEGGTAVWGDAATIIPWNLYKFYGDKEILSESYDSMKKWVDYVTGVDGDDRNWGKVFQYGDWLALDDPNGKKDSVKGGTDDAYIAYVYYLYSIRLVLKTAEVLGITADNSKYQALEKKTYEYIREEFFTKTGRCAVPTQTAYTLALLHGLAPKEDRIVESLKQSIQAAGNKLRTGFVGTPLVSGILSKYGYDRIAYTILHNEQYPGWLYEINLGATTVWERWNSMEEDGSVSSTGMNSFNHYAYGSIGQWMYETMGGIIPDENAPGFKHAIIRPIPDFKSKFANVCYNSPSGKYEVEWKALDENTVYTKVTVPFNCTATLLLPYAADTDETRQLEPGVYEVTYKTKEPLKNKFTIDDKVSEIFADPDYYNALQKEMPEILGIPEGIRHLSLRAIQQHHGAEDDGGKKLEKIEKILASV